MNWQDRIAYKFSGRNRQHKFDYFMRVFRPTESTRILDVGAAEDEYSETDNLLEKLYPHPQQLTVLGIDRYDKFRQRYPKVSTHVYDGTTFPFEDNSFEICWSNAVIEHVGDATRQIHFLSEIRRVARNAYLTTPNRYFPVEVHTRTPLLHFLPKAAFDRYLHVIGKSWAAGDYMFLLSERDLQHLLRCAGIERFTIKRNRLLGWTLDFVIMFGEKFETNGIRIQDTIDF